MRRIVFRERCGDGGRDTVALLPCQRNRYQLRAKVRGHASQYKPGRYRGVLITFGSHRRLTLSVGTDVRRKSCYIKPICHYGRV